MSLLLYGITEAGGCPLPQYDSGGRQLRGIIDGQLRAVVSEHDPGDREPTVTSLRAYERTLRRLMACGAILPARFGSVIPDDDAVAAFLHGRHTELLLRLRHVAEAVELALRACCTVDESPGSGHQSGTAYMQARLEQRRRARRIARELDPLTTLARSVRRELAPEPGIPVRDSYLIDKQRVEEFVALVRQLDTQLDDVELLCTGPWPPYSFAEGASK